MRSEARALVPAALLACAALACAAAPAPVDRFYRLDAGAPASALDGPRLPGTLLVTRLRADGLIDGRALVYRRRDNPARVHQHGYDRWVGPPTELLQSELAGFLRAAGAAERVVTPEMRLEADFVVSGSVRRFERVLGEGAPEVSVELELFLTREADRELLVHGTYPATAEAGCDAVDCSAVAFGRAVGSVFERFLADLTK